MHGATVEKIGGGEGYVSPNGFTESLAHYIPETLTDLEKVLAEAKGDKLVWLPKMIEVPRVANPTGRMILGHAIGTYVGAKRGVGGLKVTGKVSGAFGTGIRVLSHSKIDGLTIEGPTNLGTKGSVGGCYTMFAFKASGVVDVEIRDCDLFNFPQGIVCLDNILASGPEDLNWDSPNRVRILYTSIHGAQAHGWGYGVLQSNANGKGLAALLYACRFWDNRHHLACDHGEPFSYEFDQCIFEDSWYWSKNIVGGTKYYACQVDAHGSGPSEAGHAGRQYEGHDSTFSENGNKANVGIRGIPGKRHNFYRCKTAKRNHSGVYPAEGYEIKMGSFVDLEASEGGPWNGENNLPKYRVFVSDNLYGSEEPEPAPNVPDIKVVSLEAPPAFVGETYTVTATVKNEGTGPGSADIEIGYLSGTVKRPLLTQAVELEAGATTTVVREAVASTVGAWTFYCGNLTAVLTVTEKPPEPPPAPILSLSCITSSVEGNTVIVAVTVANTGNAEGTASVKLGEGSQSLVVPAGQSQQATFTLAVDVVQV